MSENDVNATDNINKENDVNATDNINKENDVNATDNINKEAEIKTPDILNLDYRFERLLGEGSNGRTWLAVDRQSGEQVAIKELKLLNDIKSIEFFEREANVLKSVNIHGVPKFYKHIIQNEKSDTSYIIQEYIPYPSIQSAIDEGRRFTEDEVMQVLKGVSHILLALQTQYMPPIIHRDIKPANIMFDDTDKHNISVWLIDFGAVANPQKQSGGSTIAGTYGYMAPEQLQGECAIQSDYYALGATALHMLTGVSPYNIDVELFKLQYEPVLAEEAPDTSEHLKSILASLLAPTVSQRPQNAIKLIESLESDNDESDELEETNQSTQKLGFIDKFINKINDTVVNNSSNWKTCDCRIYNTLSLVIDGFLKVLLEAVYEYKRRSYHAFIDTKNEAVCLLSDKYIPISKDLINSCKISCLAQDSKQYQIPYQHIWLSDDIYSKLIDKSITNNVTVLIKIAFQTLTKFKKALPSNTADQYMSNFDDLTKKLQILNEAYEKQSKQLYVQAPKPKESDEKPTRNRRKNKQTNDSDVDDFSTLLLKEKKHIIQDKLQESRMQSFELQNQLGSLKHSINTINQDEDSKYSEAATAALINNKNKQKLISNQINKTNSKYLYLQEQYSKLDDLLKTPQQINSDNIDLDKEFKELHSILSDAPLPQHDNSLITPFDEIDEMIVDKNQPVLHTLTLFYYCIQSAIYKNNFKHDSVNIKSVAYKDENFKEDFEFFTLLIDNALENAKKTNPTCFEN